MSLCKHPAQGGSSVAWGQSQSFTRPSGGISAEHRARPMLPLGHLDIYRESQTEGVSRTALDELSPGLRGHAAPS